MELAVNSLDDAARIAEGVLNLRRRRAEHLPKHLFGEAAWALLLILFIADATGERLAPQEACKRTGENLPTALRWLNVLEEEDLVACRGQDDRDQLVALTPAGVHAVEACMFDARDALTARPVVS